MGCTLEVEDSDVPPCRRPKAVAFAKGVQRRMHIKSEAELVIARMLGRDRRDIPFLFASSRMSFALCEASEPKEKKAGRRLVTC